MPLILDEDGRIDYEQADRDFNNLTSQEKNQVRRQLIDDGDLEPLEGEFTPGETSRSVVGQTVRELPLEIGESVTDFVSNVGAGAFGIAENIFGLGSSAANQAGKLTDKYKEFIGLPPPDPHWRSFRTIADASEQVEEFFSGLKDDIVTPEEAQEVMSNSLIPKDFSLNEVAKSSEKFQAMYAQGLASLIPMLAGGGLAGKAGVFSASYLLNASSNFEDFSQNKNFTEAEALTRAFLFALPQAYLDGILPDKIVKGGQFAKWTNVIWAGVTEGGTEAIQGIFSIIGRMDNPVDFEKFSEIVTNGGGWQDLLEQAAVGAAVGSSVASVSKHYDAQSIGAGIAAKLLERTKQAKLQKDLANTKVKDPDPTDPAANPFPSGTTYQDAVDTTTPREVREKTIKESSRNLAFKVVEKQTEPGAKPKDPTKPSIQGGAEFNTNNFQTSDDVKIAMDVVGEVVDKEGLIDPSVQKVQKNKNLRRNSLREQERILAEFTKDSGLATDRLRKEIRDTSISTKDLNRKLVTYRAIEVSTLEQLSKLAEEIVVKGQATDSNLTKFAALEDFVVAFQPDLKSITTNVARALQSYNIQVNGKKRFDIRNLPEGESGEARVVRDSLRDLLDLNNSREGIRGRASAFLKIQNQKARVKRLRALQKQGGIGRAFLEYAQATWLGNIFNRSVEVIGPMMAYTSQLSEDIISLGLNSLTRNEYTKQVDAELKARIGSDLALITGIAQRIRQAPMAYPIALAKGLQKAGKGIKTKGFVGLEEYLENRAKLIKGREAFEGSGRTKAISKENLQDSPLFNGSVSMVGRLGTVAAKAVRAKHPSDYDFTDALWWAVDQGGALTRTVGFGVMQIIDPIVENLAFGRSATGLIHRAAWDNVRAGIMSEDNVPAFIADTSKRLEDFKNGKEFEKDTTPETKEFIASLFNAARGAASESTFKEKIEGAPGRRSVSSVLGAVDKTLNNLPILKMLSFPFFKTAVSLTRFSVRRTPVLQALSSKYRADLMGDNGQLGQQRAIAQFIIGNLLIGAFTAMWWDDKLVGSFAKGEREVKRKAGLLENSFGIPFSENGESFIQFTRLEPIASLAKMTADVWDIIALGVHDETTIEELRSALFMAMANNFFNKTYTSNVYDLFRALYDDTGYYMEKFLVDHTTGLIPFSGLTKALDTAPLSPFKDDEALREAKGFIDSIKKNTPDFVLTGLSQLPMLDEYGFDAPRRELLDLTGRPVKRQERENVFEFFGDVLNLRRSRASQRPLDRELARVGFKRSKMRNTITKAGVTIELNNEQYHRLRRILQEELHFDDRLTDLIQSDEYTNPAMSDTGRRELLAHAFSFLQGKAKLRLRDEFPEIDEEILTTRADELQLLLEPSGTPDTSAIGDLLR